MILKHNFINITFNTVSPSQKSQEHYAGENLAF